MNLAPTVRPNVAFAPIIMNALENMPNDTAVKQFKSALGAPLTKTLLENWKRVPGSERFRRYSLSREWFPPEGNFATQMASQTRLFQTAREELITSRKRIIKAEVDRALTEGIATYQPSAFVRKDALLSFEVAKKLGEKIFHRCVCEDPGNSPEPVPVKKFGLKVTRLKCHDQREAGNDEIYLVSAVVDGKGNLVTTTSARYEIDDDDDDVVYPNYYIYPMQDPGGFLDGAVAMWEDDGGYGEAGQRVTAIGNAVSKLPRAPTR